MYSEMAPQSLQMDASPCPVSSSGQGDEFLLLRETGPRSQVGWMDICHMLLLGVKH